MLPFFFSWRLMGVSRKANIRMNAASLDEYLDLVEVVGDVSGGS